MSSSASRKSRKATSLSSVMFTNAVYFPNYKIYGGATPGAMNYGCISTVYYCFANVSSDGGVFLSDEYADMSAPCDGVSGGLGSLMHLKQKHPHLQVILSIGGGQASETFPAVASTAVLRDNFARSARGLVEASGLDGIDIVWQYPSDPQQGADFLALLAAVRLYLPEEHYVLTAALPVSQVILQNIDFCQAATYLDHLNLMAYDFFGAWTPKAGYHSQLYPPSRDDPSGSAGVQYLMSQGFPARKILLGIPVFGRSFLNTSGPGHKFKGAGGMDGIFDYDVLPRKGAKEQVDKRACAAFCMGGDGGFVSYDNPDSVRHKAAFCKQKGLGGLFYWAGPADAKDSKRSLIAAGFRALHSS